jgi:hypothetical protein
MVTSDKSLYNANRALDKLAEMWDKQWMKGDDDFFESRIPHRSEKTKQDANETHGSVRQRRKRSRR